MKMLMVVFIQRKRFYIEISVRAFFNNFVSRISRCYLDKVDSAIRVYLEIFIELIKKKRIIQFYIFHATYILKRCYPERGLKRDENSDV